MHLKTWLTIDPVIDYLGFPHDVLPDHQDHQDHQMDTQSGIQSDKSSREWPEISPERKTQRKRFLSDPVAAFSELQPGCGEEPLSTLAQLQEQQHALKRQRKKLQTQARVLSRRIGEAKRIGASIKALKLSMYELTMRLDAVNDQLSAIQKQILSFFETGQDQQADTTTPAIFTERSYPSVVTDASTVSVSLLQDELNEWNSYVDRNPAISIYHRAEWAELIRNTFGHDVFYYHARDGKSNIVGILPLVRMKSRLFGDFLVSMPYFNYGGAIADHPVIEQKLIQTANEHAATMGASHIEYRDDIRRDMHHVRSEKVNMILPLPDSQAELWCSFSSKLRAQIKRPEREQPQIHIGRSEYLGDFYNVFSRLMRDLGTPVYGISFFRNILNTFPENSWIIVLRLNKKPVAAGFLIGYGDTLEIPWASSLREVKHLSMNMLLYWEVLKFSIQRGFRYFDFGRSSKDTGTFQFKQQWGAQPKQLHWHYWLGEGSELPWLSPSNPKYTVLINIWKRLPVTLTKRLGPQIVKNLP
jgi:FemAB-related protein (PEP-CTERM system-associated)